MEEINATLLKKVVLLNYIFIRRIAPRDFPPWQIAVPQRIIPIPVYHYKQYTDLVWEYYIGKYYRE